MKRKRKYFIDSKDKQNKDNFLLWIFVDNEAVSKLNNVSFQFEQLLLSSRESYKRIHFEAQLKTSLIDNPIAFARGGGTAFPTCD